MLVGRGKWRSYPKEDRIKAIQDALQVFMSAHPSNCLFASVINKKQVFPKDPIEVAFEQLASRFDHYLTRLHKKGDTHRGIIIFDKSTYESSIQSLAADFRTIGHQWGLIRNFAEVPLFIDSRASRLTQLADLIAYAIYRNFEKSDNSLFTLISKRFDSEAGIVHGLHIIE